MKEKPFELGEKTRKIYSGDIVSTCEYLCDLDGGRMLFYDLTAKCFRACFWEKMHGQFILNGWHCSITPSDLLRPRKYKC